ncbi:MAG: hypothetical protein H6733_14460 [Alphaproteobacteria bacterium]|nr:hypothetical protein [Alphaproteobacteria bacterium]
MSTIPPVQIIPPVLWQVAGGSPPAKRWRAYALTTTDDHTTIATAVRAWMASNVAGSYHIIDGPVVETSALSADFPSAGTQRQVAVYWFTDMSADAALKFRAPPTSGA